VAAQVTIDERVCACGEEGYSVDENSLNFTDLVCLLYMGVFTIRDTPRKHIGRHINEVFSGGGSSARIVATELDKLVHVQNHSAHVHVVMQAKRDQLSVKL